MNLHSFKVSVLPLHQDLAAWYFSGYQAYDCSEGEALILAAVPTSRHRHMAHVHLQAALPVWLPAVDCPIFLSFMPFSAQLLFLTF